MRIRAFAGVRSFAHLTGLAKPAAKKAEDDKKDEEAKRAEDDKKDEEAKRAEDDAAEDGDDKMDGDDGDDVDAEDDKPDEDDDEEKDGAKKAAFRSGRKAERERCAKIFSNPAAASRPDLAAHLAFNTGMSSASAIATLAAAGPARGGLNARMAAAPPPPNPGAGSSTDGGSSARSVAQKDAEMIIAAGRKARGEK